MKNIAEAGIKDIYIDHKGFNKDWAKRRGDTFENMSLRMCERSGIEVYEIWRKEQRIEQILEIFKGYRPPLEKPALANPLNDQSFEQHIEQQTAHYGAEPFAMAITTNNAGEKIVISAEPHLVIGYTSDNPEKSDDKYSFMLQPINRLITTAARKGLKIDPDFVYSSRAPTSRELVNMIGAELNQITIGDINTARDEFGPRALKQLVDAGVLKIRQ